MNDNWANAAAASDLRDTATDWMNGIEVAIGRSKGGRVRKGKLRHRRMSETKRGREILEGLDGGKGSALVGLIQAGLSQARRTGRGQRRLWRDVDWGFFEPIFAHVGEEKGIVPAWFPPSSLDPYEQETARVDPDDFDLWWRLRFSAELAEHLAGLEKALREHKQCLSEAEKKIARRRVRALKRWIDDPMQMPEKICSEWESSGASCDRYGPLEAFVEKITSACETSAPEALAETFRVP